MRYGLGFEELDPQLRDRKALVKFKQKNRIL